ncbi:MAG: polyphenol oxidase family protein [Treponema sp.]|nr:polyphenol oxidase family protein [Treponema sp.]
MNYFSITGELTEDDRIVEFPFSKNGVALVNAPKCGMTLRAAGSMRFRWSEVNMLRDRTISSICENQFTPVPIELIHSHIVFDINHPTDTYRKQGDGIITTNKKLVPIVTVADCMPVYLFDRTTGVFGIVHSGWKGTGIAVDAIELAGQKYGAKPEDFCVVIGPHINDCCYVVNEERAEYFAMNFNPECIRPVSKDYKPDWDAGEGKLFHLSLLKANLELLKRAGVLDENISVCTDCTCCNELFGSNRRETKNKMNFTVQAAFVIND